MSRLWSRECVSVEIVIPRVCQCRDCGPESVLVSRLWSRECVSVEIVIPRVC